MGSTLIEKYSAEHYAEVNRIFSEGTKEQVNKGIQLGLRNQTIQGLLALAFTMGAFFSWFHAWIFLFWALVLQWVSVFACYYTYVWNATDMQDKELKFWTTKPNRFLVAKVNGKVVGCGSYRQLNPDTVEMHRLSVDSNFRGLKIGRKLVEALMEAAKKDGYTCIYADTSNAQIDAWKMYEKMGFRFLRKSDFGPGFGAFLANNFSGLCVYVYLRRL